MSSKKHCIHSLPALILIMTSALAFAQKPVVSSVDKIIAGNEEIVTFQGSSFGTDSTKLSVSFGAAKGVVNFASDQLLEVKVPSGASYGEISISHIPSGLTEYTREDFLLSFGGNQGFGPANLDGPKNDYDAETGLYDLCACDFDGDGRTDVVGANRGSNFITLLKNTTVSPGLANINFSREPKLLNARSVHTTCGDLNGDGKPDLIFTKSGSPADEVFIYHNTSTLPGTFTFNLQTIKLLPIVSSSTVRLKRVKISDLDRDGKPELILSHESENRISVLINQSTPASISFKPAPINITIPGAATTDGLAVDDLNGDGLPEITTSQFLAPTSNLFILRNRSTLGNISMDPPIMLPLGLTVVNIKVGDLDGDRKPDIAATQLLGASVSIFLNQTSAGSIAFGTPTALSVVDRPFDLDFGDLDGDGKPDIVITSISTKSLTILNNNSTPGTLSFQRSEKPITYISRHIFIGDIDGDAKPDLAYASVDNNDTGELPSEISILRNKACPQPEISPAGPHTICTGFPLKLTTLNNPGTMYEWSDGTTTTPASPNAFFNVTASGNYTVKALAEGGTCALVSNSVTVVVDPGTATGDAVPTNNGPICIGSPLILTVNDVGGTEYKWTGPNGYTGTTINPSQVSNFQLTNAGRYNLDVIVGTCIAQQVSTVVEAVAVPQFQINSGGSSVVCSPDTKVLTVSPNLASFSYEWFERSSATVLSTTTSYNATASGEYYVKAQYTPNPSCATVETAGVLLTFATAPVADFTLPSPVCRGQNVTFTNTSSVDPSVSVTYEWKFDETNTSSSDVNPVYRYLAASTFNVKLTASYSNGTGACTDVQTKPLTVQPAPLAVITTSLGQFSFCPEGNLVLTVPGPFTSYSWNTNETTPSITVTEAGFYSVDVTTTTGCTVNATQEVVVFESPEVTIEANPSEIKEGQTATLLATGLLDYVWEPGESLSSTTISDPVASPLVTTVYTVSGIDSNGCTGEATFELKVTAGSVYGKITPSPFFSPDNGDDFGKFWNVEKIIEFPQCQVSIYDEKGVKVHEAKPYANTWDGTFNGQKLPDGVYYFIIKCEGEQNSPKTGSITLLR